MIWSKITYSHIYTPAILKKLYLFPKCYIMPQEIERKFLLANDDWRALANTSSSLQQGYLSTSPLATVRVRLENEQGTITIKGKTMGISRSEFEYEIPATEAAQLLLLCSEPLIIKTRYRIAQKNHIWEIDDFSGDNYGLVIAEIELSYEDELFEKPEWLGPEVSGDPRYYNSNLSKNPYGKW